MQGQRCAGGAPIEHQGVTVLHVPGRRPGDGVFMLALSEGL